MKKLFLLVPFLFLIGCGDIDTPLIADVPLAGKPAPADIESELFDLNKVPSITLTFTVAEWNKLLTNYDLNPQNDKKVVSNFTFSTSGKAVQLNNIGLKLKGNTSRRRPEGDTGQLHNAFNPDWHHCHFSLDFSKNIGAQRFKGLNKLNLKWCKDDATYIREIYSYDLFRRFGCWTAPKASYCKLTVQVEGDAQPAYYGVYIMLESVDEDYIAKRSAQWGPAIGWLWKGGYGDSGDNANFVQTVSMGVEDVNINANLSQYFAYDLKTREDEEVAAKAELTQFITDLNTKTGTEFRTWIAQKIDIPLFLKTYATNVIVGMWDDYWVNGNNFYFYLAPNGKFYFIPYDYDNTLGTSLLMPNSGTRNPLTWGSMTNRPLITKILAIPEYQAMYKSYITNLAFVGNDYFTASKSMLRIQNWQSKIAPFVSNDTGEDMVIQDQPASWGNQPNYRVLSGNSTGGNNGPGNFFTSRTSSIPW
jgi:spore coat protein H